MSDIQKDEAFVLEKRDYSDTSIISNIFSKENGKYTVIVKGGRNPKSKFGLIIDPMNQIEIIVYKKEHRNMQLLSGASLIASYKHIKEDIEKIKYCSAILELVRNLIPENEENARLYKGIKRIFDLFETSEEEPEILFGRFLIFFITVLGYEIDLTKCAGCGKEEFEMNGAGYNYNFGLLCSECSKNNLVSFNFSTELFTYLKCLKEGNKINVSNSKIYYTAIIFMENFLRNNISDFKGIKSLQVFK